ncbi:CotH kinase family protein [Bacteroidota bacterium]
MKIYFQNKIILCYLILIYISFPLNISASDIVINEIMSSNATILADEDGEYPDWIELYNSGDDVINMQGWILTDDPEEYKWIFPSVNIAPAQYLIVFCSGENKYDGINMHTNFKINSEGEELILFDSQSKITDRLSPVELQRDISYGRNPDGSETFMKFLTPTPGRTNNFSHELNNIEFSHNPGFYLGEFDMEILCDNPDNKIYYTLDGSVPNENSIEYSSPIKIRNRNGQPDVLSMIRTNPEDTPSGYRWEPPQDEVFKASVVRAATFDNGVRTSKVTTATYFVDPYIYERYTFPIISIITDSMNLFGFNEGIYVPGQVHADNPSWNWYWGTGNYHERGDEWERPVYIEFFERNGQRAFGQDGGVRIHGSGGRALPEKSLRLYARSEYGKNIFEYRLFTTRNKKDYKRFILRNSGQDFLWTMFADALMQDLSKHTGIEFQDWCPAIVFINGEYWGIHNIRERYDEFYLEDYCKADRDDIEIFGNELIYDPSLNSHFNEMYQFMAIQDISDDNNFDYVAQYLDIDNFINYYVQKVYFAVYDWPGNNVDLWKPNLSGAKWRWLSYDNDDGLMYVDLDFIEHITADSSEDWRNPPHTTYLFRNLIQNKKFRDKFLEILGLRMNSIFRPERVLQRIDYFKMLYEPEIDEHIARWNHPKTKEHWFECIERMRDFAINRPKNIIRHVKDHFDIDLVYYDSATVKNNYIGIYPNPNSGIFNLEIKSYMTGSSQIRIYDIMGKVVYTDNVGDFYYYDYIGLNIPNLSDGMYFLRVNIGGQIVSEKLVIEK